MKKKLAALFLALVMCASLCVPAFALEASKPTLAELAAEHITVSVSENETTYANLQEFYLEAREVLPSVSDMDLAKSVLDFTNQPYDDLSEKSILETLDFLEITTTEQFFHVKEDSAEEVSLEDIVQIESESVSPLATWTDDDGYIKIVTTASKVDSTTSDIPFILTARATWLKYPVFRFTDTFAITYGGTFDDSYVIESTFTEAGKCSECGEVFSWDETEQFGPEGLQTPHFIENSDLIELDFSQSHAIGAKIDIKTIYCAHESEGSTVNYAHTTKLTTYLRFRVLASETTEAKAVYVHTKLSGKITVGASVVDNSVTPTLKGTLTIVYSDWYANPVTLRCS